MTELDRKTHTLYISALDIEVSNHYNEKYFCLGYNRNLVVEFKTIVDLALLLRQTKRPKDA